jgi:DNA helicase HerA-like ATPase
MLNDTQSGLLNIVFRIADDNKMLLLDIKDLRAMLSYVGEMHVVSQHSTAIYRQPVLGLSNVDYSIWKIRVVIFFFGEPEFIIYDFLQTEQGKGVINILAADKLP